MFEQSLQAETRNPLADWCARGGIALVFLLAGWDKFSTDGMWPQFFHDVGIGQWFRYFTGIEELLAAVLVLIPWTARIGLALLAITMAVASILWAFVLGHPGNAIVTTAICGGLSAFCWTRKN